MADYNALKVPDLKKLLQTRSLPVSGNKAELVARLVEYEKNEQSRPGSDAASAARATGDAATAKDVTQVDQPTATSTATDATKIPAGIAPPADDEIDWGDEEPTVPTSTTTATGISPAQDQQPGITTTTTTTNQGVTEPVAAAAADDVITTAVSTNDVGSASNPKAPAVINAKADFDPSQTHDLTVKYPDATQRTSSATTNATTATTVPAESTATDATTTEKPAQNDNTKTFAAGLNSTDLDAEIARRKARALRFQTSATATTTTDTDVPPTANNADDTAHQGQEAIKALERAKRFCPMNNGLSDGNTVVDGAVNGGGAVGVKGLDQALPDGRPSRKRGRGAGHDDVDSNHRSNTNAKRRRGGPVGRDGDHDHGQNGRNTRPTRSGGGSGNGGNQSERNGRSIGGGGGNQNGKRKRSNGRITDDPVEKAKAEARAKKFAAPPPPSRPSKVATS